MKTVLSYRYGTNFFLVWGLRKTVAAVEGLCNFNENELKILQLSLAIGYRRNPIREIVILKPIFSSLIFHLSFLTTHSSSQIRHQQFHLVYQLFKFCKADVDLIAVVRLQTFIDDTTKILKRNDVVDRCNWSKRFDK